MPDPIDELENFDPGAPMTPLPASEVRRLGDRHRRRRTAGIALAAAAAVAVVATGSAVLAGRDSRTVDPAPSPSPTPSGPLLPDSLDVTVGMYENDSGEPVTQVRDGLGLSMVDFCGAGSAFADDARSDSVSAATSGPEYSDTREVILYPDERSAARVLEELETSARDCPRQESGPDNATLHEVKAWDAGESGILVVRTYTNSLGAEIMHFAQVGDALLASSTYGEYDPSNTASGEAEQARRLAPVVSQLCALFDASCASGTAVGTPTPDTDDIPEGFPLAAGWPERHEPGADNGLTGPAPDVELVEVLQVCDAALPAAPAVDRLGAVWTDVEDYRNRQLLTFEDAEGAIAYQRSLVDAYRACPRSEDGEGNAALHDVRQTRVGSESWAVVRTFEFQGAQAIGMEVVHVVRLGRALLVDTTSNEGGGGPDPDAQATAQITRQTEASSDVVAAMCAFTEAGC